jgi:hypothetical protein
VQRCHWTVSLLKRWLLGTHAGAVKPKHLQAYLDEFVFRHNRRKTVGVGRVAGHREPRHEAAADHAPARRHVETAPPLHLTSSHRLRQGDRHARELRIWAKLKDGQKVPESLSRPISAQSSRLVPWDTHDDAYMSMEFISMEDPR